MSWTVSTLCACASTKSVEVIAVNFEKTYFAVLQQFFVLNFVKKFTKVQHSFFLDFNWK
jgi:hypothetical protein